MNTPQQQQVGNYQVIKVLGQGGMGKVYKVFDVKLKRIVALKTILPDRADDSGIARFRKEALAISKLHHPSIVKIHTIGEENGIHFFTMDYVEGISLDKYVIENGLSIRKTVALMRKIAKGVHYAHSEGIVHRDLKPDNIMVDKEGNPHIMDFGLAKVDSGEYQLTKTGEILGTAFYMSPEQAEGLRNEVTAQSDVFSLGAIFYKLLTGEYAFYADSFMQLMHKIKHEDPIPLAQIRNKIPKTLEKICLQALQKDKKQRYPSAQKFAEDLGNFLHNRQVKTKSTWNMRKYQYWLMAFIFLLLVAFITLKSSSSEEQISIENLSDSISAEKALYINANDYILQKEYDKALELLQKILVEPNDVSKEQLIEKIVFILAEQRNHEKAIYYYRMLESAKSEILLTIAQVYENMEQAEEALAYLDKIILAQENYLFVAKAFYHKGLIFYKMGNHKNALLELEQSIKLLDKNSAQPNYYANLLVHKGLCLFSLGNIDTAIANFEKALPYLAKSSYLYEYLGKCYYEQKKYTTASDYFQKAIALEPQNDSHYVWLARTEEKQKNYTVAKKLLTKALTLNIVNIEAIETFVSIAVKEPEIENDYFWTITYYVGQLARAERPDTFVPEIKTLHDKYSNNYKQWLTAQNQLGNPQVFIETLTKNPNENLYNYAIEGIISLRYHQETKTLLQEYLQKTQQDEQAHKYIQHTLYVLEKQIENEQKNVFFYFLVDFYLYGKRPSLTSLEEMKDKVIEILQDESQSSYIRYFAAYSLANMGEFTVLEKISSSKFQTAALISKCVLREMGHLTAITDSYNLYEITDSFLRTKIARSMDFPLDFDAARSTSEQKNRLIYLQKWLDDSDDRVRMYAAGNLGMIKSLQTNRGFIQKIRSILSVYMEHPNPHFRNCAHYYFWRTLSWREFFPYRSLYSKALFDSSEEVTRTVLFFSFAFDMNVVASDLIKVISSTKNTITRVLAIYALSRADSEHSYLDGILFDEQEPFFIRAATATFGNYNRLLLLMQSKNMLVQYQKNLNIAKEQARQVSREENEKLKIFMYTCNSFLFNETPIEFLAEETSLDVKTHIIMASCGGYKIPMLSLLSSGGMPTKEIQKLISRYETSPHEQLQQMTITSSIVLASPSQRKLLYQKYLDSNNTLYKRGAAKGFYQLNFLNIINSQPVNIVIDRVLPHRRYENYIEQIKLLPDKWQNIEESLSYAIELAPEAKCFYERAIIKRKSNRSEEALYDLQQALLLAPENVFYQIEIADLLTDLGQVNKAQEYLATVTTQIIDYRELQKIGIVYWKLKNIEKARQYFLKSVINNKEAYHMIAYLQTLDANIWIARTYAYEGNNEMAIRYLYYRDSIEKRIYQVSRREILPLSQTTIRSFPEFQNILSHPWIQGLPR